MTNQEAIEILREKIFPCVTGDWKEAVGVAISALQAQDSPKPTAESVQNVQNEDLVSRKEAIDAIGKVSDELYENIKKGATFPQRQWFDGMAQAQSILENLPSAHPERLTDDDFETIRIHLNAYKEKLCNQGRWKEAVKYQNIIDRFMAFASAQPERKWIPVKERLPESKPEDLEYPTVIACCEDGEVMTACYYESTKEWGIGENYDRKINPVAWMPLPEPYRAERRTDAI